MGIKEIDYVGEFERSADRFVTAVFSIDKGKYTISGNLRRPDGRCPGARYFIEEVGMDGWWPIDENAVVYIGASPKPENLIGVVVVN